MTKQDLITVIDLGLSGQDHYFDLYKFTKMFEWLTEREIDFKLFYINPRDDALPHSVLLKESDATAMKLKFEYL